MRSTRWWLRAALRTLNMAVNLIGIAMIIYSLWLLKIWYDGVAKLPPSSRSELPQPWFIYTCLGVGMVVCFSTLCGYMAIHHTKHSIPCLYIATIFSLALLQGGVIITIFFNMDLESKIIKSIDDTHAKFKRFILFHLYVCLWVTITVLVAQMKLVIVASTLCVLGPEPTSNSSSHMWASVPDFRYSFLILPSHVNDNNANHFIVSQDVNNASSRTTTTPRSQVLRFLFGS